MPFGIGRGKEPRSNGGDSARRQGTRTLAQLVSTDDSGWPHVEASIAKAERPVEVLPKSTRNAEATLLALLVTTRSILGAVAFETGGILIDHGWIRMLGSGHPRIGDGLREWNASLGAEPLDPPLADALVVAYDAIGGLFAINGGRWDTDPGTMHYFAPSTFAWESMDVGHPDFVDWVMSERLDQFYAAERWPGWHEEVAGLGPDQVLSFWPPIGVEGSKGRAMALAERSRRPVPAREHWSFLNDLGRQLRELPGGTDFRVTFTDAD